MRRTFMIAAVLMLLAPCTAGADEYEDAYVCTERWEEVPDREKTTAACSRLIGNILLDIKLRSDAYAMRARDYEVRGELLLAARDLRKAVALFPEGAYVRDRLRQFLLEHGEHAR